MVKNFYLVVKIFAINFLVLIFLLISIESLARLYVTFKSCLQDRCDYTSLTHLKVRDSKKFRSEYIGLSRLDPSLGYVPNPGFKGIIDAPGWNHSLVSINKDGFRSNDNHFTGAANSAYRILAVGDSFTFGDQVSNNETWPSCFKENLSIRSIMGVYLVMERLKP